MLLVSLSMFLWVPMFVEVRDSGGKSREKRDPSCGSTKSTDSVFHRSGKKEEDTKKEENGNDVQIQKAERIEIYRNEAEKVKKIKKQTPGLTKKKRTKHHFAI